MATRRAKTLVDELHKLDEMDAPERYEHLTLDSREALRRWIDASIKPISRVGPNTSYGLKHFFEKSPEGFYVENGQFKAAMVEAGYQPVDPKAKNWRFKAKLVDG
jgi:hypothetical protein